MPDFTGLVARLQPRAIAAPSCAPVFSSVRSFWRGEHLSDMASQSTTFKDRVSTLSVQPPQGCRPRAAVQGYARTEDPSGCESQHAYSHCWPRGTIVHHLPNRRPEHSPGYGQLPASQVMVMGMVHRCSSNGSAAHGWISATLGNFLLSRQLLMTNSAGAQSVVCGDLYVRKTQRMRATATSTTSTCHRCSCLLVCGDIWIVVSSEVM